MAIKFSGEFTVKRNPDEVYDFLTDPGRFAPLLPEFQSLAVQDEKHFTVKVNVGVSYIKGVADVRLELSEASRPTRAQYKGQGAVAGGNVTLLASFDLASDGAAPSLPDFDPGTDMSFVPEFNPGDSAPINASAVVCNGGTKVIWQGEAQVFGRLASVAGGLLEPLGKKQLQKLIDGLQAALA